MRLLLVVISALGLTCIFSPLEWGWLAWIVLLPFFFSLETLSTREAFFQGYLTGFLAFSGSLYWLYLLTVPGAFLLCTLLAFAFGIWAALSRRTLQSGSWAFLWVAPSAWVVTEYLRGHLFTGFGWNLLGHSQWDQTLLIQICDLTGVYGVSFLIVWVNAALFLLLKRRGALTLVAALSLLGVVIGYGNFRLNQLEAIPKDESTFQALVVQGNIAQAEKWDEVFQAKVWGRYEALSIEAGEQKPDLIIWPETSVPGYLKTEAIAQRLESIVRAVGIQFLVGVPVMIGDWSDDLVYNSTVLLDRDGRQLQRHSKLHLVPFGEYIPLKPIFGWLRHAYPIGNYSPGDGFTVFEPPPTASGATIPPFSTLICFEDLFPELARGFVREGAQLLVVVTNDAWFARTAASLQHMQATIFRAVENRVWAARAGNTGWSGFIDPAGRILPAPAQVPRFEPGWAMATLQPAPFPSPYTRWGDLFVLLCLGGVALTWLVRRRYNHP